MQAPHFEFAINWSCEKHLQFLHHHIKFCNEFNMSIGLYDIQLLVLQSSWNLMHVHNIKWYDEYQYLLKNLHHKQDLQ